MKTKKLLRLTEIALSTAVVVSSLLAIPLDAHADPLGEDGVSTAGSIRVHGHWTIEVFDAGGRLVTREEFENSLTGSGSETLARILTRQAVPGKWIVQLEPCPGSADCSIGEPHTAGRASANLMVSVVAGPALELSGSVTADANGTIEWVVTRLSTCDATVTPRSCESDNPREFTFKSVASLGISVVEGQVIQVKVVISFS